jgi:uncharacterized protein (DUF934 family)
MPKLIKNGELIDDDWAGKLLSLDDFNAGAAAEAELIGVQLEADQPPSAIEGDLSRLDLVVINFPVFTDGRGFSYARQLREWGYQGEIRASGEIIRDQLHYLRRCGFNAFEFDTDVDLEPYLDSLRDFSEAYQGDVEQEEPLFRRR